MAVMADESTVTGFLLTGIGERNKKGESNFHITDKATEDAEVQQVLKGWLDRNDISIVLITQTDAEKARNIIREHEEDEKRILPTILEIPSSTAPYDPSIDPMMKYMATRLYGQEVGMQKLME